MKNNCLYFLKDYFQHFDVSISQMLLNENIKKTLKFNKFTSFEKGFSNTYEWYKKYYKKLIN